MHPWRLERSCRLSLAVAIGVGLALAACGADQPLPQAVEKPSPRSLAVMAYDPVAHLTLLHGGLTRVADVAHTISVKPLTDSWTWDGSRWAKLGSQGPSDATGAMAYDDAEQALVFFGVPTPSLVDSQFVPGKGATSTWLWKGGAWRDAKPAVVPPVLTEPLSMAYDVAGKQLLLLGALTPSTYTDPAQRQLWAWKGGVWTKLWETPAAVAPEEFPSHIVTFPDGSVGGMGALPGGSDEDSAIGFTSRWDGTTWQRQTITGTPASIGNIVYDSERHVVVAYGTDGVSATPWGNYATFLFNGTTWNRIDLTPLPAGRLEAATAFDGVSKATLFFSGSTGDADPGDDSNQTFDDLWGWNGSSWGKL